MIWFFNSHSGYGGAASENFALRHKISDFAKFGLVQTESAEVAGVTYLIMYSYV